jgi:hypothetical protein
VRTTNGLNVPTGWGQQRPADRRPCPICHRATGVEDGPVGKRLRQHYRAASNGVGVICAGSGRLVTA